MNEDTTSKPDVLRIGYYREDYYLQNDGRPLLYSEETTHFFPAENFEVLEWASSKVREEITHSGVYVSNVRFQSDFAYAELEYEDEDPSAENGGER